MEDTIEWSEWWLPGKPETRIKGALNFDPANGATVNLLDMLPDPHGTRVPAPALLGEDFEGNALTLLYPFLSGTFMHMTPARAWGRAIVVGSTLLRGCHVEDPNSLTFNRAVVRLAGLRDVCLQEARSANGEWVPWVGPGLLARQVETEGGRLQFRQSNERTSNKYSESTELHIEVEIVSNLSLTLANFDARWINPLEALTILAARGPSALQRFTFTIANAHGAETLVEVHTRTPTLAPTLPDEYQPLVPFAALRESADAFIARWWELYRQLGPAADYLIAALSADNMYLEQKLLAAMSFVESYHRELHGTPIVSKADHKRNVKAMLAVIESKAHRRRYREVLAHAGEQIARERVETLVTRAHQTVPDIDGLNSTLTNELVKTRNAITHLDRSISKALDGIDLHYAVERLRLVIQINLLLDLHLSRDTVRSFVLGSYNEQLSTIVSRNEQGSPVQRVAMDRPTGT